MRVLVAVPLCSPPSKLTLDSLVDMDKGSCGLDILFILYGFEDDRAEAYMTINNEEERLRRQFNNIFVHEASFQSFIYKDEAAVKNFALNFAREKHYDGLFFIDPNIYLPPNALVNLIEMDAHIATGVTSITIKIPDAGREARRVFSWIGAFDNPDARIPFINLPFEIKIKGFPPCRLLKKEALYERGLNFTITPVYKQLLSADNSFLLRARAFGLMIKADPRVLCRREKEELELREEDLKKLRAITYSIFFFKKRVIAFLEYEVRAKYIWFPENFLSENFPFKGWLEPWLEPSNRLFLIQSSPREFVPLFGADKIREIKDPNQKIEAIVLSGKTKLTALERNQLIITTPHIYKSLGFEDLIDFLQNFMK